MVEKYRVLTDDTFYRCKYVDMIQRHYGIKDLRKELGVTQEDLAFKVGVTRQTIISLENGKYNASLQLAYKIAKYFGMTIEEVFVFEDEDLK